MSSPLRICMVTTFYPPYHFGGDAVYVRRLSDELARRGHQVEVIHNADAYRVLAGREPARINANHSNITVHTLRSDNPLLSTLAMQQTGTPALHSRRIRAILDRDWDVIHYHNISLAGGPQVLQYGRGLKLYTLHEYWLVCPTHVLFRFNREACTRRSCVLCQLLYRRPPQLWRYTSLLQRSTARVQAFLAPTRFAAEKYRQLGLAGPLLHLPHLAPPIGPDPAHSVSASLPYFLFVGRLERLKGLHTLIPAFRRHPRAQLWIAGTGSDEAHLRAMASGYDNIRFLGHVDAAALPALYRDAAALIVPSLCYEVSSLVALEAWQQGTPVIARKLGAVSELVQDCSGGLVYETEEELLSSIEGVLRDRSWRDELGARGEQACLQEWSAGAHLDRYLALIEQLRSPSGTEGT